MPLQNVFYFTIISIDINEENKELQNINPLEDEKISVNFHSLYFIFFIKIGHLLRVI